MVRYKDKDSKKEDWQTRSLSVLSFLARPRIVVALVGFQPSDVATRQCSSELGITLAAPSVLVHVIAVAAALGEQLACNLTRLTVLDGDGLHGSRVTQGECLAVERTLSRWRRAVGGVVDLRTGRAAHAHRGSLSKRSRTADRGRSQ